MAACAWSIPPAFATAVRARCMSSANGTAAQRPNRVRSACCSIPWRWDQLHSSGETGADDISGGRVSVCTANTWTSRQSQPLLPPQPSLLRRSLVLNVRITACHGMSGWRGPARAEMADRITLTLFGIPERMATFLGLATASRTLSLQGSIPLFGQACFSEWPLLSAFLDRSSHPLSFSPFSLSSLHFSSL